MKASFYLCLAGGLLRLRCTSVEISRRRCSNVRCLLVRRLLAVLPLQLLFDLPQTKRIITWLRWDLIQCNDLRWLHPRYWNDRPYARMTSVTCDHKQSYLQWTCTSTAAALWQRLCNEIKQTQRHFALMCPCSTKHLQRSFSWQTQPTASITLTCPGIKAFNCFYSKAFVSNPFPTVREQFT